MRQPLSLENDDFQVHPFRSEDFNHISTLVKEIYKLLSDDETLHFIPEKRLYSIADAHNWLKSTILNFHCGRNFVHFIKEKSTGNLLGMVDIISPQLAKAHYQIERYPFFIEFYLSGNARGKRIMTSLLPQIIAKMQQNEIQVIGAVVNRKNLAAQKVLTKTGFTYQTSFDQFQNLYEISLNENSESIKKAS